MHEDNLRVIISDFNNISRISSMVRSFKMTKQLQYVFLYLVFFSALTGAQGVQSKQAGRQASKQAAGKQAIKQSIKQART